MKRFATVMACCVCCFALAFSLAGCGQSKKDEVDEAQTNRAYMSQLNTAMEDLNSKLDTFTEAVSEGDLITMRTVAKKIDAQIEEIGDLEVPKALKDLGEQYMNGLDDLNGALDEYIDLFEDVEDGKVVDVKSQIEKIQKAYDAGIKELKDADKAATKL